MAGRRWRRLQALGIGLALGLAASVASAEPRFGGRPGGPPGGPRMRPPIDRVLERHAERLGLDAEVRESIRAIAESGRSEEDAQRDHLEALSTELRGALGADAPDESKVMELADRIGTIETERRKQRLRTMLRIRALLTPEQRAELVKIHEEKGPRRGPRHGPRWGPPGGPRGEGPPRP